MGASSDVSVYRLKRLNERMGKERGMLERYVTRQYVQNQHGQIVPAMVSDHGGPMYYMPRQEVAR